MLASTSPVLAPSSGGARYSFTGVPEKVMALRISDRSVAAASSAGVFPAAPALACVGFGAYATALRASVL